MSGPSLQPHFPFVPDYMSWEDWNGNVAIFYSQEHIPFSSEDEWKETAKVLAGNAAFLEYPIPHPEQYDEWQDWARAFTLIVNGQSY